MGEMAEDAYAQLWIDEAGSEVMTENIEAAFADGIWVTKDGRYLYVKEMENTHLLNCINLLGKAGYTGEGISVYDGYIKLFDAELNSRWEGTDET